MHKRKEKIDDNSDDVEIETTLISGSTSNFIDGPIDAEQQQKESSVKDEPFCRRSLTIDDAVEMLGFGPFHIITLFATGFCFMSDAMEITLLGFLSTILKHEWNLSHFQAASITGAVFLGQFFGALTFGPLGDRLGRRPVFLLAALIISVSGAGTALANHFASLVVLRFIVGFGVGGIAIPFDVFAEFLPSKQRAHYLIYISYFWTIGSALATLLAYLTIGLGNSWRLFVFLCSLPCFVSLIMCYWYVPESPRWLVSRGRNEEAMEILKGAAEWNGKRSVIADFVLESEEVEEHSNFRDLLSPQWRRLTLLLWGVWIGFGFSYNGTILTMTRVFEDTTADTSSSSSSTSFHYTPILFSSIAETLGIFICIFTVEKLGRIKTQILCFVLAGTTVVLLLLSMMGREGGENSNGVLGVESTILAFLARAFEVSCGIVIWIITAEVLRTEIRATGHSAARAACQVGAILTSYAVQGNTSLLQLAFLMGIVNIMAILCVSQLPETKGVALGSVVTDAARSEGQSSYVGIR